MAGESERRKQINKYLVGGVVGGGITFVAFKPCCYRLKDALQDTMLSNPDHISSVEENKLLDEIISGKIIDAEFVDDNEVNNFE